MRAGRWGRAGIAATAMAASACGNGNLAGVFDAGPGSGADATAAPPVMHLGLDAGIPPEEPSSDAGFDAAACEPLDAVVIPAFVPPSAPKSVCTEAQIEALYDDCWNSTKAACDAFYGDPANSPCILCMDPAMTNPSWGPIIAFSNDSSQANIGGCVALIEGDAGPDSCGAKVEAYKLCRHAACAAPCPSGATTAGIQAFDDCEVQSETGVCAPYVAAAQCDLADRFAPCLYANFESSVIAYGRIFCGGGFDAGLEASPTDAASDAASDAPSE
jgi:hypothetical protein